MSGQCSIDGCTRPAKARGWCGAHHERWRKTGNPHLIIVRSNPVYKKATLATTRSGELRYRIDPTTGCWLWLGGTTKGYGILRWQGRTQYAHRLYFEQVYGELPKGFDPDHVCCNPLCVNPGPLHPEAVTHAENIRRGKAAARHRREGERAALLEKVS